MTGTLNDVKSVGASGTTTVIKATTGVVKAIYVTKANATDVMHVCDNATTNSGTQFTIEADAGQTLPLINREFANGITVAFTGTTARYLIVFE